MPGKRRKRPAPCQPQAARTAKRVRAPAKGAASSASTATPSMYDALASKLSAKRRQFTIGHSLESMIRQQVSDPDATTLLRWLQAITTGGQVSCEGKQMVLQKHSLGPSHCLAMTKDFERRHHGLAEALREAVAASNKKWKFQMGSEKAGHVISKKRDLVVFLLTARRVALSDARFVRNF